MYFGRSITVSWSSGTATVTSSAGGSVTIGSSSISYGNGETTSFTYTDVNAIFGYGTKEGGSTYIPYHLLTGITHPNGDTTTYEYIYHDAGMPDGSIESYYPIGKRYDTISGVKKNELTYSYQGSAKSDYSAMISEKIAQIRDETIDIPELWGNYGVSADELGMFGFYSSTVSDGEIQTTYTFNCHGRCIQEETVAVTEVIVEADDVWVVQSDERLDFGVKGLPRFIGDEFVHCDHFGSKDVTELLRAYLVDRRKATAAKLLNDLVVVDDFSRLHNVNLNERTSEVFKEIQKPNSSFRR